MVKKIYIRYIFWSIGLLLPQLTLAQTTGDIVASEDSLPNAYVGNFRQKFMVKTFLANRNLSFNLKSRVGRRESITYSPNGNYFVGLGFFYKKLGFELGFKIPVSDKMNQRYGQTRYLDLQTNFYGTRFGGDLAYQRYSGFYPREAVLLDSTWRPGNNYPYRSDITARNIAANAYYIFNHEKFSYKAAYTQTEKQLKSAGSFILMNSLSHMRFDGQRAILPGNEGAVAGENTAFEGGDFFSVALLPGYAYTYVIDEFYFSASAHLGGGFQYKHYTLNGQVFDEYTLTRKNHLRVAGGYYGNRFLAGLSAIIDNTPIRMHNITLSASSFNIKLFVGYRFDAHSVDRKIDRSVNKIKKKIPPGLKPKAR